MFPHFKRQEVRPSLSHAGLIALPEPRLDSATSVEAALQRRRSIREYSDEPLALGDLAQLLWAAQGITDPARGYRTAASAGALYPLEIYVAAGHVRDLAAGVYRYRPHDHALELVSRGDVRSELAEAAVGQTWMQEGAALLVFAAQYERTTVKYGERGIRYVHIETGHAAQNVYLQAVALGLGTVAVGAFDDEEIKALTSMEETEHPLLIMPIGRISTS